MPECPLDRVTLDPEKDIFPDKATERNILSCHVRCPSEGCEWTGETRNVEFHLQSCDRKIIHCSNPHCKMTVERRLMEDHARSTCQWRPVNCVNCDEQYAKCNEHEHSLECRRRPIDCANGCGEVIPREEMTAHQDVDCSQTLVSCLYDFLGCGTKIKRCEMKDHLEENLRGHFEMSVDKLSAVQDECRILRRELDQVKLDYRTVGSKLAFLEKEITNVKLQNKDMQTSSSFIWKVTNFWERVCKAKTGKEMRVESDSFYIGPQGYKMKMAMYPNGTKEARNAHISLYIALMKGKYDAILPWPFRYKVTLTIIDQKPDLMTRQDFVKSFVPEPDWKSMQRPTGEENERRGFGRFFSHEKLGAGSYVVNDTLFVKFEVSPGDLDKTNYTDL